MEEYEGPKFRAIKVPGEVPLRCAERLLSLDAQPGAFLPPSTNGNLSILCEKGFLIKGTGATLTLLAIEDLSYVFSLDERSLSVTFAGAAPSSESFMHHLIYRSVPASSILHFHGEELLSRSLPFPSVPPLPYGSLELAKAVSLEAKRSKTIILREHGFVIWAESDGELLSLLRNLLQK
ncbi:MAG: class II aldolase/adducin family protein [Candidatus Micrarchaeota archaeon]